LFKVSGSQEERERLREEERGRGREGEMERGREGERERGSHRSLGDTHVAQHASFPYQKRLPSLP
jgi:hypothetical protein